MLRCLQSCGLHTKLYADTLHGPTFSLTLRAVYMGSHNMSHYSLKKTLKARFKIRFRALYKFILLFT